MRLEGLVLVLSVALSGCTAIKATVHMAEAEQALAEARNRNAQNQAVYEYTMAIRYLEKAREENGSSDYKISQKLAQRSAEWSDKAIITIEGGRRGLESLDNLGDLPTGPAGSAGPAAEPQPLVDAPLPEPEAPADDGWQPLDDADDDEPAKDESEAGDEFESLDDLDDFEMDE